MTSSFTAFPLLFLSLFATRSAVTAQEVDFELHSMSKGSYPALVTTVEGADDRLAASLWSDLMREYGGKPRRSRPEKYKNEALVISSVGGSDPLNVYADFEERGDDVQVLVWVELKDSQFLDSKSGSTSAVENAIALMQEYALGVRRAAINQELEDEQKKLNKIERKLRNLERDLAGYERDIERAKEAIGRAETNIVKNGQEQEETRVEIERAAANVEAVREKLADVGG